MVRISNAGEKWSNCSPGRLIIERTMAALHRDGVREVDFSIGNYAYKRRFGVAPIALADLSAALSWRGLPYALRDRAARELRNYPRLSHYQARARQAAPRERLIGPSLAEQIGGIPRMKCRPRASTDGFFRVPRSRP
jgi:CelD/BcsL family acetyltransferase involved in cellulose biosynthesis